MGKRKSRSWSPRPSCEQSGVLNYSSITAKKRILTNKTRRRRARAKQLAHERDAIRQEVDAENGVNFDAVAQLLSRNEGMTLKKAKRLACNV